MTMGKNNNDIQKEIKDKENPSCTPAPYYSLFVSSNKKSTQSSFNKKYVLFFMEKGTERP